MLPSYFVIFGAVINIAGTLTYFFDVLKGKVKPNRVSWTLWTLAPMLAFFAELHEGVGIRSLMTFMAGFNPMLILFASFLNKKSYWKITVLDYFCGGLSLLGLVLFLITKQGFWAITFAISSDALAAVPTIIKSFKDPASENWKAFFGGGISAVIALLTIKTWTYANYGFPIYILLICTTFIVLIKFRIGLKFGANKKVAAVS
jgi:hypothetical protein